MPVALDPVSAQLEEAFRAAGRRAIAEALAAGLPVFHLDANGLNVMEHPDGRRFEIRWLPGSASGENFEVIRELKPRA
jgi:hypothetical protein